eukprot:m.878194 g.878194  ORF g.878194 m.878194 type:complete len:614 (-) comp23585_c0_seq24:2281-4122(-)
MVWGTKLNAGAVSKWWNSLIIVITFCASCGGTKKPICPARRENLQELAKQMFDFSYSSYLEHAFPLDELDPIHCAGRSIDRQNPDNININDVLGNYSLTLIDSLDTLAIMGNASEFARAVRLVVQHVSFDQDAIVQVFEVTIRAMGGLLSAHLIAKNRDFGVHVEDYDDELLWLARDLGGRLLPAFDNSPTGIPHPRVHLQTGVPPRGRTDTCTSGAGSLVLEFGVLSRLTGDAVFESVARRAVRALWRRRDPVTKLFGSTIDVHTGQWLDTTSGAGAGTDSFFEYMFKAYVLFGDVQYYEMFHESVEAMGTTMWVGNPPVFANVNMHTGNVTNYWMDSLQAYAPGTLGAAGYISVAISHHAIYYSIWRRFHAMPERFNWVHKTPDVAFYPLRPEFAEATYTLYRITRDPFYVDAGRHMLCDLHHYTKAKCGYGTVHSVLNMELEDRMESFFLSETLKYLYLLFAEDHTLHNSTMDADHVFTTEGHIFRLSPLFNSGNSSFSFFEQESDDGDDDEEEVLLLRGRRVMNKQKMTVNVTNGSIVPAKRIPVATNSLGEHSACHDRTPMQKLFHPVPNLDAMMEFIGVAHPRTPYLAAEREQGFSVESMFSTVGRT